MTQLNPAALPKVAVDFMNNDHHEAVELINTLLADIEAKDADKVTQGLQDFLQHNTEHFAREEEQMIRINFPPYGCHKGEHERVLAELQAEIQHWQEEQDFNHLHHYLSETVVNWLVNHVNTMDSVTAMFIQRFDEAS